MTRLGSFLERLLFLAQKEMLHILRDRQVIYLALGMPVIMVLLFGYAITFDVDQVRVAVVDHDRSPRSRSLLEAMRASNAFRVVRHLERADDAETLFRRGEVKGVFVIPADYSQRLKRDGAATVQLLMDGSDGTSTQMALGHASNIAQAQTILLLRRVGVAARLPVEPRVRAWYNPDMRSALFVVPGLVAIVVGILGVLLSALSVAREWERGSMEQLFTTPVGRLSVVLGKLFPYIALGVLQLLLVLVAGAWLFDVPLRGSFALLAIAALLFLVCVMGQGLLISMLTRNQQVATQVGALTALLPGLLLSGFLFPIDNMPWPLRALSVAVPARHMITCMRGILLQGYSTMQLWPSLLSMAVLGLLLVAASTLRFRRRLD
jgi:ABC-2 type transport system permease protein